MVLFRFSKDCVSLSFQGRSGFSAAQRHQSCFETGRILFEQAIRLFVCLFDMDRLFQFPSEMQLFQRAKKEYSKKKYAGKVMFIETNPCTEFWFLLHFLPNVVCRRYESYDQLLPELQKYMPGYEKTKRYFIRTNLYKHLTENGDLERAMSNSEKLCQLCKESPEDLKAYSEIHKVINLLNNV